VSKEISKLTQLEEGGNNPKSGLYEKPLWELEFEDGSIRILGKPKMEEYLSKAYNNTVHHFNKRVSVLHDERKIIQWCVVFIDYQDVLLATNELCNMLYLGHQRKDEEKYKEIEEKLAKKRLPENSALFHPKRITTEEERKELDEFRRKISEEAKNDEENQDIIMGKY